MRPRIVIHYELYLNKKRCQELPSQEYVSESLDVVEGV